jgi:hypothetical protein
MYSGLSLEDLKVRGCLVDLGINNRLISKLTFFLMFAILKCLTQYKYTMMYQSNTTKLYYVYYYIRATCFDSYRIIFRPFQGTDPYLAMFKMFKMRCRIPNAYILHITMYKMHVSLCYYYTIRILIV